jgi:membrane-associated phospholipid phosphatase
MLRRNCVCMLVMLFLTVPHGAVLAQNPAPQEEQQQEQQQAQEQQPPQEHPEPQEQQQPQGQQPAKTPPPLEPGQVVRPSETASTSSTARRILTNFWSDQKSMWTSPFHVNGDNAKWWGLFVGSTAALLPMDKRLSNSLPNTVTQISFSKNVSRIGASYTTVPVAGILYLYGRKKNDAKAREAGVLGAEALLDSAIIVQVLKVATGRERPDLEGGRGRFFKGKDGFPSGHVTETWAFASLISHEYAGSKIVPVIAYGLATTVSVARFTGRKHYVSDIVAGGAMGWFIGKYVFDHHLDPNIHKRYETKPVSRFMPKISPMLVPSMRTYGVALAWNN